MLYDSSSFALRASCLDNLTHRLPWAVEARSIFTRCSAKLVLFFNQTLLRTVATLDQMNCLASELRPEENSMVGGPRCEFLEGE
jgi:hypothetical protein